MAGGACCSNCQSQHRDVPYRYSKESEGVNSEPEQPFSMRCTVSKSETFFLVLLPSDGEKGTGGSPFPCNPVPLPLCPLHTQLSNGERKGCVGSRGIQSQCQRTERCV